MPHQPATMAHRSSSGVESALEDSVKPLNVLIVGGGIGGLTAAIALRRQGHHVEVFEQSELLQETGAAIHVAPNANGVLRRLGLDVSEIGATECASSTFFAPNGKELFSLAIKGSGANLWAYPWNLVHRQHLHTALKELAVGEEGKGKPVRLHLSSRLASVNAAAATIELEDGRVVRGDVIVGADGVHAKSRKFIPGGDLKPMGSGSSAFRFLIAVEDLKADPRTAEIATQPDRMVGWMDADRRMVMYPCVNNTVMNFVLIHPSQESQSEDSVQATWQDTGNKSRMLEIYKTWAPDVLAIMEKADASKLKVWELLDMQPMPCYNFEKLAIIGDAAHPFLPHLGQGGAQAIEDAVAIAAVLPLGTAPSEVPDRLKLYNECRYERAQGIQLDSRVLGWTKEERAAKGIPELSPGVYNTRSFGHDAWDHATTMLQKHLQARDPESRFRSPTAFGSVPGPRRPLGLPASHPAILALQSKTPESMTTWTVRCLSTRTHLERFLAPGFSFTSPGSRANISFSIVSFDGIAWLGGGGYNAIAVLINGIEYKKGDGSKVYGSFMTALFEDFADPIITGRDELGHPKIFCDIDVKRLNDGCAAKLSWRGTEFATFEVADLKAEPKSNGENALPLAKEHATAPPQPSLPPPEEGIFTYRYIPAVGQPGKADAEYPVLSPFPTPKPGQRHPDVLATKTAHLEFTNPGWKSLPTLNHIAEALADIPILQVEGARMTTAVGIVDNGAGVQRIE
ncbi:hypothetical protein EDB81DRAFT_732082, partial [Dactylonectria macrodidyma]